MNKFKQYKTVVLSLFSIMRAELSTYTPLGSGSPKHWVRIYTNDNQCSYVEFDSKKEAEELLAEILKDLQSL